ncbi:MAG: elongation factor Ts [Flavobacteriales bacterium]|nr:Elongation factor Ts [Flavobacteriales bacterium]MBX2958766.1 elongation factor Ts [Flavobacteriales bacterium]HRN40742.1 translation elongation factor Ts [Vicingus sp.]HRP59710.1 translation elongation factor Ts [Vicingus sp.]
MSNITAADVNKLRQTTGAGMMDCKKALVEAEGDFEKAIDILRKKGQKVAANRSDRDAKEGLVLAKTTADGKKAVMVVVNCETDFVAKNDDFNAFATRILDVAMEKNPTSIDELKALSFNGNGLTIADKITEQTGVIGEKIDVSGYEVVTGELTVAYNHPGNKLASIVSLNKAGGSVADAAKQVAMQIAAMDPIAIDETQVPEAVVAREMEIGRDQALQEGKPADMVDKIAEGKVKKYLKENTLLNQPSIKDNKKTVAQTLQEVESGLTVVGFKRIMLG